MGEQIFSSLFSPVVQTNLLWSQGLLKLKILFTSWFSLWDVTTRTAMRIQCICVGAFADKHIAWYHLNQGHNISTIPRVSLLLLLLVLFSFLAKVLITTAAL